MTAHLIYGPPGAGKDMYQAWIAARRVPRGYRKYADYCLNDATLITSYADMLVSTFFGRSYWFMSEIGTKFDNRAWADLDPVELCAVSQHRKSDLMLFANSQHPGDVDSKLKARLEWDIRVTRLGPRGDSAISLGKAKPGLFEHPWAFVARWYAREDFSMDTWELKQTMPGTPAPARRVDRFLYSARVANSYVSNETIFPMDLLERVRQQRVGAEVRADLPRMVVRGGKVQAVVLDEDTRARLVVPKRVKGGKLPPGARDGAKGSGAGSAPALPWPVARMDDPDLRLQLRMRGYYVPEEVGPDGEPTVDLFGHPLEVEADADVLEGAVEDVSA
jgi:hypothetical protein